LADLPFKAMYCKAAVAEDQVFAAGGEKVVFFDPLLERWHLCPSLPGPCSMLCAALAPSPLASGHEKPC